MNEKHAKLKKYNQEYWAQNKDTIKEKRDVKRSEASKEKNRVNARKYYQQHKQDICKKQRESEAYNAKRREYSRQYYWNNRDDAEGVNFGKCSELTFCPCLLTSEG
jgi:hypothetical protein